MLGVEEGPGVGTGVVDHDGDEGGGGDGLAALPAPLDAGVTLAVIQSHRVVTSLGGLHILGPGDLTSRYCNALQLSSSKIPHLIFVSLDALSDWHQNSVNVSIQGGLLPVTADQRELGNEGDGGEDLAVGGGVGAGRHLGVGAGRHGGAHQEEDRQHGGFHHDNLDLSAELMN